MGSAEQPQPPEEARGEKAVLIVEDGAAADGAGLGIDRVIDEIHSPHMREFRLVGEADGHGIRRVARRGPRPGGGETEIMQKVRFAAVEHEMDGIDRHDDAQERRAGLAARNEVAGIDALVGNAAGNGRADLGPFEIELRLFQSGVGGVELARGVALDRFSRVEFPYGQRLILDQRRRAIDVLGSDVELRLRPFDIGFRQLDGDLVGALIDDEQQVVLLDDLPFLEMNGVDESGNPGADFDSLQCGEAAGIFVPLGNALLERVRDGDGWRGRTRISGRLAVTAGQHVGDQQQSNQRHNADHGGNSPTHCDLAWRPECSPDQC